MIVVVAALALLCLFAFATWLVRRRPDGGTPPPVIESPGEARVRARALRLRDELDHSPFGEGLARAVWSRLITCPEGEGLIREFHRDFCGHGLIRTDNGVKLCDITDGGHITGDPIAAWSSEQEFVAFFAGQSDFSCSGWDATEPVFATDDEWYRDNQRLTREVFQRFVSAPPASQG